MPTIDLAIGRLEYRVFGPHASGAPTAVFVHGFLVNGSLWDAPAALLAADGIRCIVPDWPLGAHRTPVDPDAELSPESLAGAIAELLDALDLHGVVLVGSDTGGGLCQLALRGDVGRIGGLVLTNCDAFDRFPPPFFVPLFVLARYRLALWSMLQPIRLRPVRHSPIGFGPLLNRPLPPALTRSWVKPALSDRHVRRDINRFARAMRRTELIDSGPWLSRFDKPVRLVWGTRDRHFTIDMGKRLAATFPDAGIEEVPDATTFVAVDRPDTVAGAIRHLLSPGGRPAP